MRRYLKPLSLVMALTLLVNILTFSVFSATKNDNSSGADIDVEASKVSYTNATSNYKTYSGSDLGANYTPAATTFKVWAPSASTVKLNLYKTGSDSESGAGKIGTYDMTLDSSTGVWSVVQNGDLKNVYYTYSVTVSGKTKETQDVYSKATGVNGARSMVIDMASTNPDGWTNDKHVLFDSAAKAAVWEVSIRDFTIDASSGVDADKRGKFLGFAQRGTTLNGAGNVKTGIDYLVENKINCVQIMPMYDFGSVDETKGGQNWGYDPVNYNVPDGSFSSDPYHGDVRVKELKTMIKALHDAGISVIMDVVYNHMYSADDSCFEKTVPGYYFRMDGSTYLNGSDCGNVTASDKTMYRKFMIDSTRYWAEEYHIDGFRFDLMGCHDITTMNQIRSELDKIDQRIIMHGEPWPAFSGWSGHNGISMTNACVTDQSSKVNARIGMFNDNFRDALKGSTDKEDKGYIQGVTTNEAAIKAGVCGGVSTTFGKRYQAPSQAVSYNSAHDNLTLWDKIVKSMGSTDYDGTNATYLAINKLSAALIFTSQGKAFTQAGEEFARTKHGDHNSYKSGDTVNKFDWSRVVKYKNLVDYYKGLRTIRQVYSPFTDGTVTSANTMYLSYPCPSGVIAFTIQNKTANASKEWGTVAVITNVTSSQQSVTLQSTGTVPTSWATIVNGTSAGLKNLGTVSGKTITVPARTAMVLVDKASFDARNIEEDTNPTTPQKSTVTWNTTKIKGFKDGTTTEEYTSSAGMITKVVQPEDGYKIAYAQVINNGTDITSTAFNSSTNTINFMRNGNATITLVAVAGGEKHLYGDVDSNDVVDVRDATAVQKATAGIINLDEIQEKAADVNGDKIMDVRDATLIQKKCASIVTEFPVGESFDTGGGDFTFPTQPSSSSSVTSSTSATTPSSSTEGGTVSFSSTIDQGDERWAAYMWNDAGDMWWADVVGGTVQVPSGATSIIFVRMRGTSTENAWDPEGVTDDEKNVWNQTDDLPLIIGAKYQVTGWGNGWGALLDCTYS